MAQGAWCGFKYFDFRGQTGVQVVTRGDGQGKLLVSLGKDTAPFAEVPIRPSSSWAAAEAQIPALEGVQALYFRFQGTGAMDFKEFTLK